MQFGIISANKAVRNQKKIPQDVGDNAKQREKREREREREIK
jgi:hypothetical protein